jgi:hypothetical protein
MADGPVRWRGGRGEEVALPRPSRGLAVSDRLAGAFRPDRGDGLREASDCPRFRLCMEVVEDGMIEDGMTRFIVESGPWAIWAASTDDKSAPASKKASPRTANESAYRALISAAAEHWPASATPRFNAARDEAGLRTAGIRARADFRDPLEKGARTSIRHPDGW